MYGSLWDPLLSAKRILGNLAQKEQIFLRTNLWCFLANLELVLSTFKHLKFLLMALSRTLILQFGQNILSSLQLPYCFFFSQYIFDAFNAFFLNDQKLIQQSVSLTFCLFDQVYIESLIDRQRLDKACKSSFVMLFENLRAGRSQSFLYTLWSRDCALRSIYCC